MARAVLGMINEAPGSVSLDTMLSEIDKLLAVRAIGAGGAVFAAPRVGEHRAAAAALAAGQTELGGLVNASGAARGRLTVRGRRVPAASWKAASRSSCSC
jgi:hypothetical protein